MKIVIIIEFLTKLLDLISDALSRRRKAEREETLNEINKDPVDWINSRYGDGVQPNAKTEDIGDPEADSKRV